MSVDNELFNSRTNYSILFYFENLFSEINSDRPYDNSWYIYLLHIQHIIYQCLLEKVWYYNFVCDCQENSKGKKTFLYMYWLTNCCLKLSKQYISHGFMTRASLQIMHRVARNLWFGWSMGDKSKIENNW